MFMHRHQPNRFYTSITQKCCEDEQRNIDTTLIKSEQQKINKYFVNCGIKCRSKLRDLVSASGNGPIEIVGPRGRTKEKKAKNVVSAAKQERENDSGKYQA